ncbi:hypothetical protein KIN20_007886 [Parelaphostrongylus tenuis]|uniref:Uncharacterized protein n=1 Tax=Parelaphostrongylus tenuis TaxID=148309 RepID=A0AAD5M3Z9_PARTN|nr:hypothetical protein KIN20_007886 [Parelaphostrongylus tenuis]
MIALRTSALSPFNKVICAPKKMVAIGLLLLFFVVSSVSGICDRTREVRYHYGTINDVPYMVKKWLDAIVKLLKKYWVSLSRRASHDTCELLCAVNTLPGSKLIILLFVITH